MASANRPDAIRFLARCDFTPRSSDWAPAKVANRKKRGRAKPCLALRYRTLECELQPASDQPLTRCTGDLHERRGTDGAARSAEMRRVRQVEELRPELQLHPLLDREYAEDA